MSCNFVSLVATTGEGLITQIVKQKNALPEFGHRGKGNSLNVSHKNHHKSMKNLRTTKIAKKIFGMGFISVAYPKPTDSALLSKFNYYSLGFVVLLLSLFIVSCKDNLLEEKIIDNQRLTVDLAKNWFEKNVSNNSIVSTVNSHGFYKAVYWKKATEKVDSKTGGHYFEIPVFEVTSANLKEYDLEKAAIQSLTKRSIPNSWTNLKIFKGGNNLIEYQIITYVPNPEFYKNENALSTKLTGCIVAKDWKDNILKVVQVKDDIEGVELQNPKSIKNAKTEMVQKNGTLFCIKNAKNGSKENQENSCTLRA